MFIIIIIVIVIDGLSRDAVNEYCCVTRERRCISSMTFRARARVSSSSVDRIEMSRMRHSVIPVVSCRCLPCLLARRTVFRPDTPRPIREDERGESARSIFASRAETSPPSPRPSAIFPLPIQRCLDSRITITLVCRRSHRVRTGVYAVARNPRAALHILFFDGRLAPRGGR